MSSGAAKRWLVCTVAALALGTLGCGGDDEADLPESELSVEEATAPLPGAPPELQAIRDDANRILDGGLNAFEARLAELEGTPIVVNKWASWCAPCIYEFPHFQEAAIARGDEVAFLGIDFDDGREFAEDFLSRYPVPYPSYADPDSDLSRSVEADYTPSTVFLGRDGEVLHTKFGQYESASALIADVDRYAAG